LNEFTAEEQGRLINWGYALADAGMRKYVLKGAVPAGSWPDPGFPL
jgi:NTE family protein